MAIYTVDVPEHFEKQIKKRGYDVLSWIRSQFNELLDDIKKEKINDLIKNKTTEIDNHLQNVKDGLKVKEKKV